MRMNESYRYHVQFPQRKGVTGQANLKHEFIKKVKTHFMHCTF